MTTDLKLRQILSEHQQCIIDNRLKTETNSHW